MRTGMMSQAMAVIHGGGQPEEKALRCSFVDFTM
jgi:hypothetical protein